MSIMCLLLLLLLLLGQESEAALVTYSVEKPLELGSLSPVFSLTVPYHVSFVDVNASNCPIALDWERCEPRAMTFTPGEDCKWPLRLIFEFDYGEIPEFPLRRYEVTAMIARRYEFKRQRHNSDDLCLLWGDPDLEGIAETPHEIMTRQSLGLSYMTRLCRLQSEPGHSVWAIQSSLDRTTVMYNPDNANGQPFFVLDSESFVQTVAPTISFSKRIAPITELDRDAPVVLSGPRSNRNCYCGYNVVCQEDLYGLTAERDRLYLHQKLLGARPDMQPFPRIGAQQTSNTDNATGNAFLVLFLILSILILAATGYLYFSKRVFVLRNTQTTREIVDTF